MSEERASRHGSGSAARAAVADRRATSLVLSASRPARAAGPGTDSGEPVSEGPLRPVDPDSWLDSLDAPSSASASAETARGPGGGPVDPQARRLGRYQILDTLGKGGYGRVYKAWDPQLEREVAVKVLLRTDPNAYRRFAREVKVTARLRHPGIVAVYDSGTAHGLPFLVMDYVPGCSLWELGKRLHELPPAEAARLMCEVSQAIAHAHAHGVLHRDIKPANVLVTPDGQAFVVDFGLARTEEMDRLTQTGAVLGTPLFMPLEQARARQAADELCDVYALGATLYYALTGRPPHVAESLKELMAEMAQLPEAPSALNPLVPAGLDAICLRALQPDRSKRTPSAAALAGELEAFGRGSEGAPARSHGPALWRAARAGAGRAAGYMRRAIKGREQVVLTGCYAAVVTLVCVSLLLRGRGEPAPAGAREVAAAMTSAPGQTGDQASPPASGEAASPDASGRATQGALALERARERGRDLERQARALEAEGPDAVAAAQEALEATIAAGEPLPDAQALGLLGVLRARRDPARPDPSAGRLLERALAAIGSGADRLPESAVLRFWRGVALAGEEQAGLAEREWVRARECCPARLQDLRLAHQDGLSAATRDLLLGVAGVPAEGLPAAPAGVPPRLQERARALVEQLPAMAREDLLSALLRAAEGRRWADVELGLSRLELWAKDSPLVAGERARLLVGRVRIQEAQQALVRARELGLPAAGLDWLGVDLLWRQGRRADAAAAAQALARRERGPDGRAAGALHHLLSGRPEAALVEADLGLAGAPEHVPCWLLRSLSLSALGEPWGGLAAARAAWELEGLSDELTTAAWIAAQAAIVARSGSELGQGHVLGAWLSFQGLLARCESAFARLVLVRQAVAAPVLHEWAAEWLSGAQQRAPRAAEVPLLRGALALLGGGERVTVDAAWTQARHLAPDARIPAAWAEAYRRVCGEEASLPVE